MVIDTIFFMVFILPAIVVIGCWYFIGVNVAVVVVVVGVICQCSSFMTFSLSAIFYYFVF